MDGPAIFDNVKGCHISVAAQQLQVRGSQDSEFAVYSANKPTIEHSAGALAPLFTGKFSACWLLRPVHKRIAATSPSGGPVPGPTALLAQGVWTELRGCPCSLSVSALAMCRAALHMLDGGLPGADQPLLQGQFGPQSQSVGQGVSLPCVICCNIATLECSAPG